MTLFLNLLIISGLLVAGYRWTRKSPLNKFYWPALVLKIVMGVLLGVIYLNYYSGGDTFSFFESAILFKDVAFQSWGNFIDLYVRSDYQALPGFQYAWIPSAFFVKILAFLALVTADNYWLSGIYLSIFSFWGLWTWTEILVRLTKSIRVSMLVGFLFPSILFWSSGVMKESLAIPALAVLLAIFIKYYLGYKLGWKQVVLALVLLIILATLKYFVAAILIAIVISVLVARKLLPVDGHWYSELLLISTMLFVAGCVVSLLHPNLWPSRIIEVIFINYTEFVKSSSAGSVIIYEGFRPDFLSVVYYLPKAIFAGLFLPLLPVPGSLISIASVFENWILLVSTIASIVLIRLPQKRELRFCIWGGLLFVLISAGLIALSTPNLGTLARYKTSYLLVFLPIVIPGLFRAYRKIVDKG